MFYLLGLVWAVRLILIFLTDLKDLLFSYVFPRILPTRKFNELYGPWAIITGCTGGIGRSYTFQLANRGLNVIMVSRDYAKLTSLEQEIKTKFNVKTVVIQADFTKSSNLCKVVKDIKNANLDIGILVNNVGMSGPYMPFTVMESDTVTDMVSVNITTATVLCHQVLPGMVRRGRGAIINIASLGSFMPGPYFAQYIATKHYMHIFTEALAAETQGTGVTIQEVDPGQVETAMTEDIALFPGTPGPEEFVASALSTLGWAPRTCGWWPHSIQARLLELAYQHLPMWVFSVAGKKQYEYGRKKKQLRKNN